MRAAPRDISVARLLPRLQPSRMSTVELRALEDEQRRILREQFALADDPLGPPRAGVRAPGDAAKLRGIPVVGVKGGLGGTVRTQCSLCGAWHRSPTECEQQLIA